MSNVKMKSLCQTLIDVAATFVCLKTAPALSENTMVRFILFGIGKIGSFVLGDKLLHKSNGNKVKTEADQSKIDKSQICRSFMDLALNFLLLKHIGELNDEPNENSAWQYTLLAFGGTLSSYVTHNHEELLGNVNNHYPHSGDDLE